VIKISLEILKQIVYKCTKCELCKTRTHVVFGTGDPNAKILFIGEGPGENEDLTGIPFVGRGGKLLDKFLDIINLSRDKNIYIANIIKCRPPNNRDPDKLEINACINYLRLQFKIIKPVIIICLGRIASMTIIKNDFKVTREHGVWFYKNKINLMGTFHPAALLRDPNKIKIAKHDFEILKAKILELNLFNN